MKRNNASNSGRPRTEHGTRRRSLGAALSILFVLWISLPANASPAFSRHEDSGVGQTPSGPAVRQWAVSLRDDAGLPLDRGAVDQIACLQNLKNAGPVGELEGFWLFEAAEDYQHDCAGGHCLRKRTSAEVDFELNEHVDVRWIEEQKPQKRVTRTVPEFADPLFGDQWHLVRLVARYPVYQFF
jgi:hypothetical protein